MNRNTILMAIAALILIPGIATAGSILLIHGQSGTSEPGTTTAIRANFVTQATSLGHVVTESDGIPGSFAGFDQVWDIRFSNVFALTAAQRTAYVAYLAGGGGMFVMGENSGFMPRNNSVLSLISEAGGGALVFTVPGSSTQTVFAPFTGPDAVASVTYAAPGGTGGAGDVGTGQWITSHIPSGTGAGIAWGTGTLANANAGALTVVFDVNWMQNSFDPPDDTNLLRNIIGFVQEEVDPVPEPGTVALFGLGLGLGGFAAARRRRRRRACA